LDLLTETVLVFSAAVAVWTDLRTGYIYNWLTVPVFFMGMIYAYLTVGWSGTGHALAGALLAAVTTFQFSTPGGGDIKLAMAVGTWIGVSGWPIYFIGVGVTRLFLSFLVRFKIYGWHLVPVARGIYAELLTWQLPPVGHRNFRLFQEPALKLDTDLDVPALPGALWVAGGVLAYILF